MTTTPSQKVILLGASGTLGIYILQSLLNSQSPIFDITVVTRPTSKTTFPTHPRLTHLHLPLDSLPDLTSAFTSHSAVMNALAISTFPLTPTIISACLTAGASRYITNDFGNAPDFAALAELEWTRDARREALAHTIATGHFLDLAISWYQRIFGFDVVGKKARLVDGGNETFSATTRGDVGEAVVGVLRNRPQTVNRWVMVKSLELSQRELLRAFEEVMGKWEVEDVRSEVLYEEGKRLVEEGKRAEAVAKFLPVQIFQGGTGRYDFEKGRWDNQLLGVRKRSVEEVVKDVLASM